MNRLQRKISHLQNILNTKYLAPPLPPLIDVHTEYMMLKARPPIVEPEPIVEPQPIVEPPPPPPLMIIPQEELLRLTPLVSLMIIVEEPEYTVTQIQEEPDVEEPVDEFTDVPEEEIEQREAEQKALEEQLARLELEKLVKKKPRTKINK